jgi:hypothetical protein
VSRKTRIGALVVAASVLPAVVIGVLALLSMRPAPLPPGAASASTVSPIEAPLSAPPDSADRGRIEAPLPR